MRYKIFYQTKSKAEVTTVEAKNPDQAVLKLSFSLNEPILDYNFEDRAVLKFNGGRLALLCSQCGKILKVGIEFTQIETDYALGKIKYLPPLKCDKSCKKDLEVSEG